MRDVPDFRTQAKRLVDSLPDGAGWDELAYEVSVRQAIEQGLADVTAGRTVEHDVLMAWIREATRRLEELREGVRAEEVFEEVRKSLGLGGPTNPSLHTAERYSTRPLKVIYDRDTDSLYIDLVDRPSADSLEAIDGVVLDFDAEGRLVGIEIEQASQKIELERL